MNIQECQAKKREAEAQIMRILDDFHVSTGLAPVSIEALTLTMDHLGVRDKEARIVSVKLQVEL